MNMNDAFLGSLIFNKNGGGGGDSGYERLCYVDYVGRDIPEIPTINTIDTASDYENYLSYDSGTKKFTVLQGFTAVITAWVTPYRDGGSNSNGAFYVNDTKIMNFYSPSGMGNTGGDSKVIPFNQGDTFYSYTTSDSGYPKQMLKVYRINGITSGEASGIVSFANEEEQEETLEGQSDSVPSKQ